jgi:DNA-binding LacI/PurR family transcriptional regulator
MPPQTRSKPDEDPTPRPRRITQKDLARRAGMTQATISLALRNDAKISQETRERVQKIAQEMNYEPDPYLSGLSAYRNQTRTHTYHGTIAWLSNWHRPTTANWDGVNRWYFEGATRHAAQLGYRIEEHAIRAKGMSPERLAQILQARGIQGLLLPPQPTAGMEIEFPFERFSVLTFGYTLAKPEFNTVALHHYRAVELLFRKLLELDYKRPGLALDAAHDARVDCLWSAAFWSEQRRLPTSRRVPLLVEKNLDRARFVGWVQRHKPDVIVASAQDSHQWLIESGVSVPRDMGFTLLTASADSYFSGIWQNLQITGAKAVDALIDMIHRGERGIPPVRSSILVDASWRPGSTVRESKEKSA